MVRSQLVIAMTMINALHFSLRDLQKPMSKYFPKFAGERRGEVAHTG